MAKILVTFDTVDEGFDRLHEGNEVIRPPKGRDFSLEEIRALVKDCDVLCSVFDIPIGEDVISRGERLKLIANYAVGYNNIDIAYAKEHGVAVTNTPHSVVIPTAELAFGLLIDCSRRISELDRLIRKTGPKVNLTRIGRLGIDLYGKTIGIIGYGNIGGALAERCRAFGMKVLYNKRTRLPQEEEAERGLSYYSSIDEMLPLCDVVSLHTPLSAETRHLIDERRLALMKDGAILLNTARGPVVDEAALIAALKSGKLRAAGLDVFEHNDIPSPELLEMEQVVMTPHVGTQTYDGRRTMVDELVDNVLGFLAGSKDISRVV